MEILTTVRRLYICFKSLVNDFVYSFGRAALLLLVEVQNHTVPVRERRRIRVKQLIFPQAVRTSVFRFVLRRSCYFSKPNRRFDLYKKDKINFYDVCFLLGNSPASEFYIPTFRNTLFHLQRQVGVERTRRKFEIKNIYELFRRF